MCEMTSSINNSTLFLPTTQALEHQQMHWRHQMDTFSALPALAKTVTRSFGVFFDLRLNKRLSKQSRRRWFETPSCSLWRHCNMTNAKPTDTGSKVHVQGSMEVYDQEFLDLKLNLMLLFASVYMRNRVHVLEYFSAIVWCAGWHFPLSWLCLFIVRSFTTWYYTCICTQLPR